MTFTILPSVEVTAPPLVPYPFGLFSVAPAETPADEHWQAGVWWQSFGCSPATVTYGPCTVEDDVLPLADNVTCGYKGADAFTVFAKSTASAGGMTEAEKFGQARQLLIAGEQAAVEAALWGSLINAVGVADGTAAADNLAEGVAMAEGLIAQAYGGTAVLHMSRYTATKAHEVLRVNGSRLQTMLGSDVVAGGGYLPAPTTASQATIIFATGALKIVRGPIIDLGVHYDTEVNDISAVVERTYSVGWDCAAVRVAVPALT